MTVSSEMHGTEWANLNGRVNEKVKSYSERFSGPSAKRGSYNNQEAAPIHHGHNVRQAHRSQIQSSTIPSKAPIAGSCRKARTSASGGSNVRWNRLNVPDVFRRTQRRKGLKGFLDSNELLATGSWSHLCLLRHPCVTVSLILHNYVNGQQALSERIILSIAWVTYFHI